MHYRSPSCQQRVWQNLLMARTDPQIKFYATAELKEKIDAAAQASGRSLSAEINARLQKSFERPVIEWKGAPIPGRSEEDQRLLQIASRGCNMMATVISQMAADVKDARQLELLRQCEDLARSLAEATKQRETA